MSASLPSSPCIIGIAGGSGSGKSELAVSLARHLDPHTTLISQDWYYRDQGGVASDAGHLLNFDHPKAFDSALLRSHLLKLKSWQTVFTPRYDYATHRRLETTVPATPSPIILLEGILILHDARLRDLLDLTVFIDVPPDVRLMRRIRRDANGRGIPVSDTLRLYEDYVQPMHERFVQPSARHASLVWHQPTDHGFPDRLKRRLQKLLPKTTGSPT